MSEIRRVLCYITPDRVAEGFYTFDGETIMMMGDDGNGKWSPVLVDDEPVTERVTPENVVAVAKVLTKRIRKAFLGEQVEGFGRGHRIEYSNEGIA